jgi:hypothetical protein
MAQTVATTASTMSTAKPLLPEIALTMVTSLKATYSSPCLVSPTPGNGSLTYTVFYGGRLNEELVFNCSYGLASVKYLKGTGSKKPGAGLGRLSVTWAVPVALAALLLGSVMAACGSSDARVSSPTTTAVSSCAKGTTRPPPGSPGQPRIVAQWKPSVPNTAPMRVGALPPVVKYMGQLSGRNHYCISSYSTGLTDSGGPLVEIYVYPGISGAEVRALANLMKHSGRFQTVRVSGSAN